MKAQQTRVPLQVELDYFRPSHRLKMQNKRSDPRHCKIADFVKSNREQMISNPTKAEKNIFYTQHHTPPGWSVLDHFLSLTLPFFFVAFFLLVIIDSVFKFLLFHNFRYLTLPFFFVAFFLLGIIDSVFKFLFFHKNLFRINNRSHRRMSLPLWSLDTWQIYVKNWTCELGKKIQTLA